MDTFLAKGPNHGQGFPPVPISDKDPHIHAREKYPSFIFYHPDSHNATSQLPNLTIQIITNLEIPITK